MRMSSKCTGSAPASSLLQGQSGLSSSQHPQFNLKTMLFFGIWYFFNVVYNIANKKFLNLIPLPVTTAFLQTILGIPVFGILWIIRPQSLPKFNIKQDFKNSLMASASHAMGQLASVVSFSLGSVSFIHVVKAAEPIIAALLSRLFMNQTLPWSAYASLLLIAIGVAISSSSEMSFSWKIFGAAMASNVFYQLRMVLAKSDMNNSQRQQQSLPEHSDFNEEKPEKISAANMFRIITIISTILLLPLALLIDGFEIVSMWRAAVESNKTTNGYLFLQLFSSGFSYYIYNEAAFWILELVQPVTHAVGNSLKRIVIIISSIVFLSNPVTLLGFVGAIIAILGTLLYSLATISSKNF